MDIEQPWTTEHSRTYPQQAAKIINAARAALGTAPATHVPASEALSLVIEAWDRYCDGGRTENDAETFVIMFNAARRDATPVPAKWIDDPHDIEQGQMLNPEWLAFHGVTAQQIPKP